jgi:hypothetical protein
MSSELHEDGRRREASPFLPKTAESLGLRGTIGPEQATAGALPALAAAAATTPVEPKRFGAMTDGEKARNLAGLMDSSAATLTQNGVSNHMEDLLAGVMMNEGGTNTRREKIGKYFRGMMMGDGKKNTGVLGQIEGVGLETLRGDPAAVAKLKKSLGEDQQYLVDQAVSGAIDVEGLRSDDKERKAAAQAGLLQSGIDHRTAQFEEYSALDARKRGGETLSKEETARLNKLGSISGSAMGFDSLDRRNGKDATMADVRGLSSDRFAEIYEDGQVRFEPAHYRRFRDQYEAQTAANAKRDPDKQKPVTMGTAIGDYTVQDHDKESLGQNYDLLADMTTSYGAAQVMGLYGHQGKLKAKDGEGSDVNFGLPELKAAGRRHTVTDEDLQLQIAMLKMKNLDMGSKNMTAETMTDQYNGDRKINKNWATYVSRLKGNVGTYQRAEAALDAENKAKTQPHSHYAQ